LKYEKHILTHTQKSNIEPTVVIWRYNGTSIENPCIGGSNPSLGTI